MKTTRRRILHDAKSDALTSISADLKTNSIAAMKPSIPIRLRWLVVLIAVHCIVIQPTPTRAAALSPAEQAYLKAKGTIVFVSQSHYPPFEYLGSDGDHTGMCIELVRWIATEFGFRVHFTDTSFKEAQEAILSGKADILTSLFYSAKRDEAFDFTKVIFKVPASIFVLADRPDIKAIDDLQGKTIAMQAGDYAQEFLQEKHIESTVIFTKNFAEATDLVIAGKADALVGDEQIVLFHIFSNQLTRRIKKVGDPLYIGNNCMAVQEPNPMLISILNKGIERAQSNGVLASISKKWIGTRYDDPIPSWVHRFFAFFLIAVGGIIVLAVLVWIWNIRLRQRVADRTKALVESEKTLRTILTTSPLGIGMIKGRTLGWHNPSMRQMLGYESDELEGRDLDALYPDHHQLDTTTQMVKRAIQESTHATVETKWMRKDGSVFDCQLHYAPVRIEGSQPLGIAVAQDITERKRYQDALIASEALFRDLAEKLPFPLVVGRAGHTTEFVNSKFTEVFGYTIQEIPNQKAWREKLFPDPTYRSAISSEVDDWITKDDYSTSFARHYTDKWGRVHDVIVQVINLKNRFYNVIEDITEAKRSAQERERLINDLQDALARVRTLSGLIPICASCKKIRDDKGYWNQIEQYISEHTEADFSHGLCPDCMDRMYGDQDWYKNRKK